MWKIDKQEMIGKKRGLVDSDYRALGNGSGRAVR